MEKPLTTYNFHMGIHTDTLYGRRVFRTKRCGKERERTDKNKKSQKNPKSSPKSKGQIEKFVKNFVFGKSAFHILPWRLFNTRINFSLSIMWNSIEAIELTILNVSKAPFKPSPLSPPLKEFWSKEFYESLYEAVKYTKRVRGIFRRFLHRWRLTRLTFMNTEDIFTSEIPKDPILIVDWKTLQVWQFEASTLMRDITARLQQHDGFFEDPQVPRNPYTNSPLTQSQTISVWNQLSQSRAVASSWFSNYRQARWQMKKFLEEYNIPIQLHAFRATMRNMSHSDTQERLLDFIQYSYNQNIMDCDELSYKYAITHYPEHKIILKWRDLCLKFYEASIMYYAHPDILYTRQAHIVFETRRLLLLQNIFIRLRNLSLKKTSQEIALCLIFDILE